MHVREGFWSEFDTRSPSEKQLAFAKKYGVDLQGLHREVADAVVDDLMTEPNIEAVEAGALLPAPESSMSARQPTDGPGHFIDPADGTFYFKGGQVNRAWARNLRHVSQGGVANAAGFSRERRGPVITQPNNERSDG